MKIDVIVAPALYYYAYINVQTATTNYKHGSIWQIFSEYRDFFKKHLKPSFMQNNKLNWTGVMGDIQLIKKQYSTWCGKILVPIVYSVSKDMEKSIHFKSCQQQFDHFYGIMLLNLFYFSLFQSTIKTIGTKFV